MSKRRSASARLFDALRAADRALSYIGDLSISEFSTDDKVQSAVYFQLIVIGEAMNHAVRDEPALRDEFAALPEIVGLRNRIAHSYHEIDDDVILAVLKTKLPEFRQQVERIVSSRPVPEDFDSDPTKDRGR